jgi:hypothetical protein
MSKFKFAGFAFSFFLLGLLFDNFVLKPKPLEPSNDELKIHLINETLIRVFDKNSFSYYSCPNNNFVAFNNLSKRSTYIFKRVEVEKLCNKTGLE